ncbi:MAG: phosphogluconate dehydrogenase (NAD(+)-dependent, decarboxylating) [Acidimicrobiales bacterium]
MKFAMVGVGRMGAGLARRAMRDGHEAVVYDINPEPVAELATEGAEPAATLAEVAAALEPPRVAWIMVPAAYAGSTVDAVAEHLESGDIIIDGGNSMWQDDVDKATELKDKGIEFVDIGTSGGVYGLERGFSMMVGGPGHAIAHLAPLLDTLAPGIDSAERTIDDGSPPRPGEHGWLHCGPNGAGHFVKMVHNGIEYGMMAAIAEGLGVISAAGAGRSEREADAETTPLRDPQYYQYDIDVGAVAEVWRRGSVISSWLIDLTAHAMAVDPALDEFGGRVSDSGEGRWTVQAAIELGVPAHTIAASLFERFASRGNDLYANKVLSAMRKEFGGHHEKPSEDGDHT